MQDQLRLTCSPSPKGPPPPSWSVHSVTRGSVHLDKAP